MSRAALESIATSRFSSSVKSASRGSVHSSSSAAAVTAAAQAVLVRFGRIDGLVNNAGIVADAQLKKMTEEQWDRVIGINLKGVYNCTRAFVDTFLYRTGDVIGAQTEGLLSRLGFALGGLVSVVLPVALVWAALGIWLGRAQEARAADTDTRDTAAGSRSAAGDVAMHAKGESP